MKNLDRVPADVLSELRKGFSHLMRDQVFSITVPLQITKSFTISKRWREELNVEWDLQQLPDETTKTLRSSAEYEALRKEFVAFDLRLSELGAQHLIRKKDFYGWLMKQEGKK